MLCGWKVDHGTVVKLAMFHKLCGTGLKAQEREISTATVPMPWLHVK